MKMNKIISTILLAATAFVVTAQETTYTNTGEAPERQRVDVPGGDAPAVCVAAPDASGKLCHALNGELEDSEVGQVGTVCLEVVVDPDDPSAEPHLEVSFDALGDWKLVANKFWYGEDIREVPQLSDFSPDLEAFDYFVCNSTGYKSWSFPAKLDLSSCAHEAVVDFSMIAYAEVEKTDDEGLAVRSTAYKAFAYEHSLDYAGSWLGWFDFKVECECGSEPPEEPKGVCETGEVELSIQSPVKKECHAIVAGGNQQSMKAGEVCVEIVNNQLEVTFEADDFWSLLRSQLWVGYGDEAALDAIPRKKSGAPDTRKFKDFSCDWKGESKVTFKINLDVECAGDDEIQVYVVAHSKVEQLDEEGELIPGTEIDVFAFEHTGDSDKWYGWFDFMVGCHCPPTRNTITLPPSLGTSAPTFTITGAPTASPTEGTPVTSAPTSAPTGVTGTESPTAEKTCEEFYAADVEEICYNMTAPEAWEPEAGKVCLSVTEGTMTVKFTSTNYWAMYQTQVWVGDSIAAVPLIEGSSALDVSSFTSVATGLQDETSYTVELSTTGLTCDENDQSTMVIVPHALVGEACDPKNGTHLWGTERHAFGGDQEVPSDDMLYYYISMPVGCICGEPVPKSPTSVGETPAPTEAPIAGTPSPTEGVPAEPTEIGRAHV